MDNYLLTIAIPTYNRKDMLNECIQRIILQNNGRIELVISDNSSTDGTDAMCCQLENTYDFIKYYKNEENKGFDYNYYNCIKKSNGKYVLVLSDDDLISNNFILKLFNILINDNLDLIALNVKGFELDKKNINENDKINILFDFDNTITFEKKFLKKFIKNISYWFTFVSMFVMRRELLSNIDEKDLKKYFGTWFMNTVFNMKCLSAGNRFAIAGGCFLNARSGNYAHYNIYDVFLKKFKYVLYECNKDFLIKKSYLKKCYKQMLKKHMNCFEYQIKIGLINTFQIKPKFRYIMHAFTFINFWLYFFPVMICPKFILKFYYRRKHS